VRPICRKTLAPHFATHVVFRDVEFDFSGKPRSKKNGGQSVCPPIAFKLVPQVDLLDRLHELARRHAVDENLVALEIGEVNPAVHIVDRHSRWNEREIGEGTLRGVGMEDAHDA
jgi:hypothetical protein